MLRRTARPRTIKRADLPNQPEIPRTTGRRTFERAIRRRKWLKRGLQAGSMTGAATALVGGILGVSRANPVAGAVGLAGIAGAHAATRKMRALEAEAMKMAVGRPIIARKLRERYATSAKTKKALAKLEMLGPLPKSLREKLVKEFDKRRTWDAESHATAAELTAHVSQKIEHAIDIATYIASERGLSRQGVKELSTGSSRCFPCSPSAPRPRR